MTTRQHDRPFELRAGPGALRNLREQGLRPGDICCMPAAAGGPKGLALLPLDRLLWREGWLPTNVPVELIGASIGAWRMAALAQPEPLAALNRLQHAYVHGQCYTAKPAPAEISTVCRQIARAVHGDGPLRVREGVALGIVTSRARGPLHDRESKLAFGRAVLSNAISRRRLAGYLERVVFHGGERPGLLDGASAFDAFGLVNVALTDANAEDALLASGTIPLLAAPVRNIAGAPPGLYWDGALVDYHLLLPYQRLTRGSTRIVLYPHFNEYVTPGWLDKHLPWRRAPRAHAWLDDVLLVAPSRSFLRSLPAGKLPDRQDFYRYGPDHAGRVRAWETAISQCESFADAVLRWMERPDPTLVEPI